MSKVQKWADWLKTSRLALLRKVAVTHAGLDLNQISVFREAGELESYFSNDSVAEETHTRTITIFHTPIH